MRAVSRQIVGSSSTIRTRLPMVVLGARAPLEELEIQHQLLEGIPVVLATRDGLVLDLGLEVAAELVKVLSQSEVQVLGELFPAPIVATVLLGPAPEEDP